MAEFEKEYKLSKVCVSNWIKHIVKNVKTAQKKVKKEYYMLFLEFKKRE